MSTHAMLKVLIVDDERAARHRLQELLGRQAGVEVAGSATNGHEAVSAIKELRPDLVFLDVQMPGLTGMEVVQTVGPEQMPAVVFVTAYDLYAIEAFDVAAVDYLLKPFDDERFAQTLARARKALAVRTMGELREQLRALVAGTTGTSEESRYLERIGVDMRGQMRIVPVEQIDFITADGSYAELHIGESTYVIREQMQVLEERLDPSRFFRVHRSTIVQLDRIEALLYGGGGDYAMRLRDGRQLRVSRGRYEELQERLGLDLSGPA